MELVVTDLTRADQDPIEGLLLDVEQRLGLVVTIHDRGSLFAGPDGEWILALHRRRHRHPYCMLDRYSRAGWDQNCLDHCRTNINAEALHRQKPFAHVCWKGTQEVVVPIFRDGVHLFTLFAGAFRHPEGTNAPPVSSFAQKVRRAYAALPKSDLEDMKSIARVLEGLGYSILHYVDQTHRFSSTTDDRKAEVRRFFYGRSHQPVRLHDLARALSLSESRASHLVRELFGRSFQQMLLQERINRARVLLMSSTYPIREVGTRVGIDNPYYFSRVFKQMVGLTPGQFRARNQKPITDGNE